MVNLNQDKERRYLKMRLDLYKDYESYKALIGKTIVFTRNAGTFEGKATKVVEAGSGLAISVDEVTLPSGKIANNITCFFSNIVEVK
jgi:hypothetical protein